MKGRLGRDGDAKKIGICIFSGVQGITAPAFKGCLFIRPMFEASFSDLKGQFERSLTWWDDCHLLHTSRGQGQMMTT